MKKVLAHILVVAILISLIGCGGSDSDNADNASKAVSAPNNEVSEAVAEEEDEEIVINSAEVTFPKVSEDRLSVETSAKEAVDLYLVARMYLDKFLQYDIASGNPEAYGALLDLTIESFENVYAAAEMLEDAAEDLEKLEANAAYYSTDGKGSYVAVNYADNSQSLFDYFNPFLYTVYAAEESEAVKWARDITERFDNAPAGKGIRTLAEQMGTDAKHAYAQLKQAQDILASDAYGDFAKTADTAYKTAKVLKTAGTAAQLTLSIVTANPVTTTEAVMAAGGILINGMNTLLEVGQTGSVLIVGDDNKLSQSLENLEDNLAPIGSAIGLYGLGSNLAKGAELLDDTPAMADSLMYIGSSLYDYVADGKILGGTFKQAEDGTVSCTIVDTMTFKTAWAKEPEAAKELLEKVGYSEEEIEEVVVAANNTEAAAEAADSFEEIPLDLIDSILEEVAASAPENYVLSEEAIAILDELAEETAKEFDALDEDAESEETEIDEDEVEEAEIEEAEIEDIEIEEISEESVEEAEEENANSGIPKVADIVGYYPFYMYMTFGDQSAEGELPQTVTSNGGNSIALTDEDGYAIYGTYDETTGMAIFKDSDGSTVKVTFTFDGGKVHAKLSMNAEYGSMSGSVDKQ